MGGKAKFYNATAVKVPIMLNRCIHISTVIIVLGLVVPACVGVCAGQTFFDVTVYCAPPGSEMAECYDPTNDKILGDNVWVFRPNGSFDAVVNTNGQELTLAGTYSKYKVEDTLRIKLDTDGDGQSDEDLYVGYHSAWIEWHPEGEKLSFVLVGY